MCSGVDSRPRCCWLGASKLPSSRPTLSQALSATSSGYLERGYQRDTSGWQAGWPVGVIIWTEVGGMYSDLRACTTARVKGVFCGGGGCAASDAIALAGDSEAGAEAVTGNGLEEPALAEVGVPLILGQVRTATTGERLVSDSKIGPAMARRSGGEAGRARRSRVVRVVIGRRLRG